MNRINRRYVTGASVSHESKPLAARRRDLHLRDRRCLPMGATRAAGGPGALSQRERHRRAYSRPPGSVSACGAPLWHSCKGGSARARVDEYEWCGAAAVAYASPLRSSGGRERQRKLRGACALGARSARSRPACWAPYIYSAVFRCEYTLLRCEWGAAAACRARSRCTGLRLCGWHARGRFFRVSEGEY